MTQKRLVSRQKGVSLWPLLVLLIVVAVLAVGGWWGWQQWQQFSSERQANSEQLQQLQLELQQQQQQAEAQQAELQRSQRELAARMQQDRQALTDLLAGGQDLWLINEARALASLASQRLLLTQDAMAARRLLQAADETLARIDEPKVIPAREALAVDMEKLSGAMRVDVQGMVLRLGALRRLSSELAVPVEVAPPERAEPDDNVTWWQEVTRRLPVTIRQHEGPVPLPLSGTQAALVRLSMDGGLQQAQMALMQGRGEAYQQALSSVSDTVAQWFRKDDPRAEQLQAALEELGGAMVAQALPEIGAGLAAIEDLKRKEGSL